MKPDIGKIERETDRIGNQAGGFATRHPRVAAVILLAVVIAIAVLALKACITNARAATIAAPTLTCTVVAGQVACTDNVPTPPAGGGTPPPVITPPVPADCVVVPLKQGTKLSFPGTVAASFKVTGPDKGKASASPYMGGGSWDFAISAKPCDFSTPVPAISTVTGKIIPGSFAITIGSNGYNTLNYKGGSNVVVGQTYYYNMRGNSGGLVLQ